jgi:hypothetical protein
MKKFYWKLLIFQTIMYGFIYTLFCFDKKHNGESKGLELKFVLIFYTISVLITFIIPMIRLYKKK